MISEGRFTLCDVVENNVSPVAENAALQCRTLKVKAVFLCCIIVENGQIAGNCKKLEPIKVLG